MSEAVASIIVGALALLGALTGTYFSNRKSAALTVYRLEKLEKTFSDDSEERNQKTDILCQRVNKLETRADLTDERVRVANHRIDDLEKRHA